MSSRPDPSPPQSHSSGIVGAPARGLVDLTGPNESQFVDHATNCLTLLKDFWGYEQFRPGQAEVVDAVLKGRDVLVHAPTSYGKSVMYQLPALLRYLDDKGPTIVISPLIRLIRDQVQGLERKGITVAFFDSLQTDEERDNELRKIHSGQCALIYVSPERLLTPRFEAEVMQRLRDIGWAKTLVIDESHVVSEWGNDFRVAYNDTSINKIRGMLGDPQVFLCSATIDTATRQELIDIFGLSGHFEYTAERDRANLQYTVHAVGSAEEKLRVLVQEMRRVKQDVGTSEWPEIIVYCNTRQGTEDLAEQLRGLRIPAAHYHAGMTTEERREVEDKLSTEEIRVVVSTTAWGMGVDRPHVRAVIHYDLPLSPAQYAQGAGRAGRDGVRAYCVLIYQPEDNIRAAHFIQANNPSREAMQKMYRWMWKMVTPSERRQAIPKHSYNFKFILPEDGQYKKFTAGRRACFTALIGAGILDVSGWTVRFLKRPAEVATFLPPQLAVDAKLERGKRNLQRMNYIALRAVAGDSIRAFLNDALGSNRLTTHLDPKDLREQIPIDRSRVLSVMRIVAERDMAFRDLFKIVKGTREGPVGLSGCLKGLTPVEVRSILNFAQWSGLVHATKRRRETWVSLSDVGREVLKESKFKGDELRKALTPATSWPKLRLRLIHPAEFALVKSTLSPWFDSNKNITSRPQFRQILEDFATQTFTFHGTTVTGAEIVKAYMGFTEATPRLGDVRDFLKCYFPAEDPLILLSDKRQKRF